MTLDERVARAGARAGCLRDRPDGAPPPRNCGDAWRSVADTLDGTGFRRHLRRLATR